jgi:glycosyltransferase involved in cell wall biosynthesis
MDKVAQPVATTMREAPATMHPRSQTCIIHFGVHKTGTTSIQQALFTRLREQDAAFVHWGWAYLERDIMAAFASEPGRLAPDLAAMDPGRREWVRSKLRETISSLPQTRLILSAECLSRFDYEELAGFVDFLRQQGLSLEAVGYLRDCHDWYESMLQQAAKSGTWNNSLFPLELGTYRESIESLDRLLGKEKVHLLKFDRARFPGGCVVRDFFAHLGLGYTEHNDPDLNLSLSMEAVKLLRAFHGSGLRRVTDPSGLQRNILLARHMATLEGPRLRLGRTLVEEQMARELNDINWLEARLGQSIREVPATLREENIHSASDLERFNPESCRWLERESGVAMENNSGNDQPRQWIALAMASLQARLWQAAQGAVTRNPLAIAVPAHNAVMKPAPCTSIPRNADSRPTASTMLHSTLASVVIPTFGRPDKLAKTLRALDRQDNTDFEVIVVDDGSSQPVQLESLPTSDRFTLSIFRQENRGPAAARNLGAQQASGGILLFTDDDCLPVPEWVTALKHAIQCCPEALIGGLTFNGLQDNRWSSASQLIIDLVYDHFNRDPEDAYFLTSNNLACRRDLFLELGGFDTDFRRAGAEDRDFCDRWRMSKRPIRLLQEPLVEHRHAQTFGKFLDLHYRYGRGAYLYQSRRQQRGSGTMAEDLGFHRALLQSAPSRLRNFPVTDKIANIFALICWQLANAAGFLREMTGGDAQPAKDMVQA